jgi:hypothetical protein
MRKAYQQAHPHAEGEGKAAAKHEIRNPKRSNSG